jgi:phospholipid/cholesterol/gamma-HCH transport system substrate-binding protein
METRARYATIGLFTLAIVAAAFGFVYWLRGVAGPDKAVYRVRFDGSVGGLTTGSPVTFNGVPVGEVTELSLDEGNPNRTSVLAAVARLAPVRSDTKVAVETQGFLGAPTLSLSGGSGAPLPKAGNSPAVIEAGDAPQDLSTVARGALRRFDNLVGDNAADIRETVSNLKTFTGVLARNSERIDGILASLEKLGGGAKQPTAQVYELTAPAARLASVPDGQLSVAEPTGIVAFDTQKILFRSGDGVTHPAEGGQWADTIPKLLQAKIVQTFENADYMRAVRAGENFSSDRQLLLDLRRFDVSETPERLAHVEFTARVVADGKVAEGRKFHAIAAVAGDDAASAASGLNHAFASAAVDLVTWAASATSAVSLQPPAAPAMQPDPADPR